MASCVIAVLAPGRRAHAIVDAGYRLSTYRFSLPNEDITPRFSMNGLDSLGVRTLMLFRDKTNTRTGRHIAAYAEYTRLLQRPTITGL